MLIQRANKGDKVITDVTELLGKDVYVKPGTKYFERLKNLDVELGGGIRIHEADADTVTTEDLIGMVSQGEIPYTISDENIARLNKTYFWNLNVSLKISFMQRSSWVVRKSSPELAKAIDAWASDKAGTHVYKALTKRYFELSKQPVTTELPEVKNGHVSPYDELFRKHAKNIGWDWQLLASIGYQESRFNPNVVSWAGAEGLMGIMLEKVTISTPTAKGLHDIALCQIGRMSRFWHISIIIIWQCRLYMIGKMAIYAERILGQQGNGQEVQRMPGAKSMRLTAP